MFSTHHMFLLKLFKIKLFVDPRNYVLKLSLEYLLGRTPELQTDRDN